MCSESASVVLSMHACAARRIAVDTKTICTHTCAARASENDLNAHMRSEINLHLMLQLLELHAHRYARTHAQRERQKTICTHTCAARRFAHAQGERQATFKNDLNAHMRSESVRKLYARTHAQRDGFQLARPADHQTVVISNESPRFDDLVGLAKTA